MSPPNDFQPPKDEKPDYLEIVVAFLTHQGHKQIEISEKLKRRGVKISQSQVSRLIDRAKKTHGILTDRNPEFNRRNVPKDLLKKLASEFESDDELNASLKAQSSAFQRVYVVQEADFIRGAAALLPNLLRNAAVLGISWGTTCRGIIDSLSAANELKNLKACIPIQGDPAFWNNSKAATLSATRLAQLMEEALISSDREQQYQYSLIGVPAYISPGKKQGVEKFYCAMPGFKAIFGKGGAADKLNGVITSVGVPSLRDPERRGIFIRERIEQGDTTLQELDKLCYGDFSGILLPKTKPSEKVEKLNSGWTGLNHGQLKKVAARDPKRNPGVIVVAEGGYKAHAVLAAVKEHFVTRLIVGAELGRSLKKLLSSR